MSRRRLSSFERLVECANSCHDRGIDHGYVYDNFRKSIQYLQAAIFLRESIYENPHNDTSISYFRLACVWKMYAKRLEDPQERRTAYIKCVQLSRREVRMTCQLCIYKEERIEDEQLRLRYGQEKILAERFGWLRGVASEAQMDDSLNQDYFRSLAKCLEYESDGDDEFAAGRYEVALSQYQCALCLHRSSEFGHAIDLADLHAKSGQCHLKMEEWKESIEEYQKAKDIYVQEYQSLLRDESSPLSEVVGVVACTPDNGRIAQINRQLGSAYLKMNQFNQALSLYAHASSVFDKIFGPEHPQCVEARDDIRLVSVKEIEWLRHKESERRRKQASSGQRKIRKSRFRISEDDNASYMPSHAIREIFIPTTEPDTSNSTRRSMQHQPSLKE